MNTKLTSKPARRRAFTLIEVIVVIAIILILVGIVLSFGFGASDRAKHRATVATLKILDGAMRDYTKVNAEPMPPQNWPGYPSDPAYDDFPATFNVNNNGTILRGTDISNWVARLRADAEAAPKLANLPAGTDPLGNAVILDAWGTPIRWVPSNVNTATGSFVGNGYFMSAGPDRRWSLSRNATNKWAHDEIYSTE